MKRYRYKILPEKHLIIKYFHGFFFMSDIINWMNETVKDSLFDPSFNVLNDYRDAESKMSYEEIHKFTEFLKGDEMSYGKRKSAFITNTPNQTVFSFLLYRFNNEELIKIKTFSNISGAAKWLGLQLSETDIIENLINDWKKENFAQPV
jgi:hypothetical protein